MASSYTIGLFQKMQEHLALCKPHDVIAFCVRFFRDEADAYPVVAHAFHLLPFLVSSEDLFRSFACTIFTHEITILGGIRDTLDGPSVCALVLRVFGEMGTKPNPAIEEVMLEYVEPLKQVEFEVFVAAVRLPLCCQALAEWLETVLLELSTFINTSTHSSIDITQMGSFLKRRRMQMADYKGISRERWSAEDEEHWERLLDVVIEDRQRSMEVKHPEGAIPLQDITRDIIRLYVKQMQ